MLMKGNIVGSIPRKESLRKVPADAAIDSKVVEASSSDSSNALSLNPKPPSNSGSGISINLSGGSTSSCFVVQGKILRNISPDSHRLIPRGPALKTIWKGSFEVVDFSCDGRLFEGFLAHPSVKISRKAYEFGRQITGVLKFRIHSRRAFWPEIFQSDCPDASDIALYFYPGKVERSRNKYSFLLKLIDNQDLMLRSQMGRVELLVFPSKLLHVDSQKLDGSSYFMWGVFRRLKGKKVAFTAEARSCLTPRSMTSNSFAKDRLLEYSTDGKVKDEDQKDVQ